MIQTSGRFEYDPNLDEFYDYEKYAATRLNGQLGEFTLNGYIAYHGTMRIDELMMKDPAESYQEEKNGWQLGGLSQ